MIPILMRCSRTVGRWPAWQKLHTYNEGVSEPAMGLLSEPGGPRVGWNNVRAASLGGLHETSICRKRSRGGVQRRNEPSEQCTGGDILGVSPTMCDKNSRRDRSVRRVANHTIFRCARWYSAE